VMNQNMVLTEPTGLHLWVLYFLPVCGRGFDLQGYRTKIVDEFGRVGARLVVSTSPTTA